MLKKDNNLKVLKLFLQSPERQTHIREISRMTGLSPPSIMRIVKKLKAEGILRTEKNRIMENVMPAEGGKFVRLKRCYNVWSLFDSGLVDFLREEYEEPECIVVFGSYSKGEDISRSDIDIAVVTRKEAQPDVSKFERMLKRRINLHEIQVSKCGGEFINSMANGVVLYGYLKVV